MKIKEHLISAANAAAKLSDFTNFKVGAIVFHKDRILGIGRNQNRSHPMQAKHATHEKKIWCHAEISAIIRTTPKEREGASILVVRPSFNTGRQNDSKPCLGCFGAIEIKSGLKFLYYFISGELVQERLW